METQQRIGMKLQLGPGFKLGFVPIFYFPVPRARYPHPVPVLVTSQLEQHIVPEQLVHLIIIFTFLRSLGFLSFV